MRLSVLLAGLFAVAPLAQAAPTHALLPDPIGGFALNKACGTAVDSKGNIYVSNAGNGKVEVFSPAGNHLASIANANTPCGLAVDTAGNLYVVEQATGDVVKYVPNAYPLADTPTYSVAVTVDGNGKAKGISVDPADDRLYVAEETRISSYDSEGRLGIDEVQRVLPTTDDGTFTLSFGGQETPPLAWDASHATVQGALEALSTVGAGDVSVAEGNASWGGREHIVTFQGSLAATDVAPIGCEANGSPSNCFTEVATDGFSGHIGEGQLTEATAVAAFTYSPQGTEGRYVFAADSATDQIQIFAGTDIRLLSAREPIDGSETPAGSLGFGAQGAALGADGLNGHLYAYDAEHNVVDEFKASGLYFSQIASPSLADAGPSGIAVDRSEGPNDGDVYVSAAAGAGAKLLAFGPVTLPARPPYVAPSRTPRPDLSVSAEGTCGVAVDSHGDLYVAERSAIKIFSPSHTLLATVTDPTLINICNLAVDSQGVLYAMDFGKATSDDERVVKFTPSSYPLDVSPSYSAPVTVDSLSEPNAIAVDPLNDHLIVADSQNPGLWEYDSAAHGSGLLNGSLGAAVLGGDIVGVAFDAEGNIYASDSGGGFGFGVHVLNHQATQQLALINGVGAPGVDSGLFVEGRIAVDWSNEDLVVFDRRFPAIQEFESRGAFVTSFGSFANAAVLPGQLAVDNSNGPNRGTVYLSFRNDVTAFGPLRYGEPPVVETGKASGIGGGSATLNATVDPRGVPVTDCHFEYLTDAQYLANGNDFSGATSVPCAQSSSQIGAGLKPAAVTAQLSGLDPQGRYRFRIVAANQFQAQLGRAVGAAGLLGPPLLTTAAAEPIAYAEATVRASIDPSGLPTTYRVRYGTTTAYGNVTSDATLPGSDGAVAVQVPLFSLAEGTTYHFRVIVENEAGSVEGPDQILATLVRAPAQSCPNAGLRLENNSTKLPDCRAYELVTPADTRGATPYTSAGSGSGDWLTNPSGPGAGDSLAFFIEATLPGAESNGYFDGLRAARGAGGWASQVFSPSFQQAGGKAAVEAGLSPDQVFSIWSVVGGSLPGALANGLYLRTPAGFEALGQGSLGIDLNAQSRFLSAGGTHIVFSTESGPGGPAVQLEPNASPSPLGAIYDRGPGGPTHVVSLLPGEVTPATTAAYHGASEDGSSIVFSVAGALYVRIDNAETVEVANAPASFAGISDDGGRIFYAAGGSLFAFDVTARSTTEIAPNSQFVNVSADGSHAYLTSTEVLDDGGAGSAGANNLYVWDGSGIRLVAVLSPQDVAEDGFPSSGVFVELGNWASEDVIGPKGNGIVGRASNASRTTPDGRVLVFQSHANLTGYDSGGHSEIYRYDSGGGQISCVSCDPSGAPAQGDAALQVITGENGSPVSATTMIPNVTANGQEVFFMSEDALLPEDANADRDVYAWSSQGSPGCARPDGCLALISSGHSDRPSFLYSMTLDGSDVFFSTAEQLISTDLPGSSSIYDARVNGGFAHPPAPAPCQGDSCQGVGSNAPGMPGAASATFNGPGNLPAVKSRQRCAKKKARRHGRCVKARHKVKRHHKPAGNHHRRTAR